MGLRATIESTDQLTSLDGVPCRVWRGKTEQGTEALFYVHRVCCLETADYRPFETELLERQPPKQGGPMAEARSIALAIPLRMIL